MFLETSGSIRVSYFYFLIRTARAAQVRFRRTVRYETLLDRRIARSINIHHEIAAYNIFVIPKADNRCDKKRKQWQYHREPKITLHRTQYTATVRRYYPTYPLAFFSTNAFVV